MSLKALPCHALQFPNKIAFANEMPIVPRQERNSSSESSDESSSSSSDDDIPSTTYGGAGTNELTLYDDEDTIDIPSTVPRDFEEAGESDDDDDDDDRTNVSRAVKSSVSELTDDEDKKQPSGRKKRKRVYFICLSMCKYDCVRRASKLLNFREVDDEDDWNIFWTDASVGIERVSQMKKWQKINHFPGMSEICRKDFLTRNMSRMQKFFSKEYSFYPKAWCLPADYSDFAKYFTEKKHRTYISKPDVGCQGRGIFLTKNPSRDIKPSDNFVVQVYVNRPFLIDGFKFDLRVYVAVTSCDPFRIFVYKDGLARFTTHSYQEPSNSNCRDIFMHLTNYAIQKRSDDFVRDEDTGTKRRITTINRWLVDHGYDTGKLWADIDDIIIKTLISAHSVLKHNYRACFAHHYRGSACFEILGFDILIDRKLKPHVLEVNHSPSFTTDSKLDREIKDALIYDTILLLNMPAADKRRFIEEEKRRVRERLFQKSNKKDSKFREEQEDLAQQWQKEIEKWEDEHMGNYRRIYPIPEVTEIYDKYFLQAGTLYSETAASKARSELAKAQIDELQKKQEKMNFFKNNKPGVSTSVNNSKEVYGESPGKRSLPIVKSSRSPSFNRIQLKRLTVNMGASVQPSQFDIDTTQPVDIDETEEMERLLLLRHRETLIRGMGIVDLCHRMLSNSNGVMPNFPPSLDILPNPSTQRNTVQQLDAADSTQNIPLVQYPGPKQSATQTNRHYSTNLVGSQVFQHYFPSQLPKYEPRPVRNAHIFDDKMLSSQNGARYNRYQQALRTSETNPRTSRSNFQAIAVPQISANPSMKAPIATTNLSFDPSIRTKSAATILRQRSGLLS
ncbi:unnamed protein product [Adineta ricciae]|uniref:Uncharacterized protein n=2 Tax=Adineta ricciae TaxID=249248 RepID=A0A814FSN9_ADIRI|nr:unnamed protein product [Adineta ricciae]